ncbi:hypothetical protein PG996_006305 [Apiospora saccharicola]|uniref:MYND-type domain-containing protein n=1 Tax=Apiospora saccharicola TaxID=335842 RepID=A0ABR1VP64_9PEZI
MAEGSSPSRDPASEQSSSAAGPSTAAAGPAKTCAQCKKAEQVSESDDGEGESNLKPCIMCKSVLYCSRDCKKAHLKQHKKVCAKLAQEYSQTADIKMASRAAPKADTHRGGLQKWQFDT